MRWVWLNLILAILTSTFISHFEVQSHPARAYLPTPNIASSSNDFSMSILDELSEWDRKKGSDSDIADETLETHLPMELLTCIEIPAPLLVGISALTPSQALSLYEDLRYPSTRAPPSSVSYSSRS